MRQQGFKAARRCFSTPERTAGAGPPIEDRRLGLVAFGQRHHVELGEKLAVVHTGIVIHQHPGDLASHPGRDERRMAVDGGVVR